MDAFSQDQQSPVDVESVIAKLDALQKGLLGLTSQVKEYRYELYESLDNACE